MALSSVSFMGDGTTRLFSVTIPYLEKAHVKVYVGGVEDTTFTWTTASSITTTGTPALSAIVLIKRTTPTTPLVDFVDGSTLTESLLDTSNLQNLYVSEETQDAATLSLALDSTDNKFNANSKVIKNLGTPVATTDAVTKEYVDVTIPANVASASASAVSASASAISAAASAVDAASSASLINPTLFVSQTAPTGSAILPTGTTAERDGTPSAGFTRFNSTTGSAEIYDGTAWGAVGGGATGGTGNAAFYLNDQTITADYTIPVGQNAGTFGQISIATGVTVTVPTDSTWSII